jgi:hypothetical protein
MTALLLRRLAWLLLACALFLSALERFNPNPPSLLIHADFQRCIHVGNGPMLTKQGRQRAPQEIT